MKYHKLANFMEQRTSWEANSHSASQETSRLVQNPTVTRTCHWSLSWATWISIFHCL